MINLAYITHSGVVVSETFIYDTIMALNAEPDIKLTFYSGVKNTKSSLGNNVDEKYTGYAQNGEKLSYGVYKIARLFGSSFAYKAKIFIQKYQAFAAIKKHLKLDTQVALIDYASSAMLVREYLEKKHIPYIVHVHGYDITSAMADPQYKIELNAVLKGAHYFIAASQYMKRLLVLIGADEAKIKVIRYGIDVEQMLPVPWEIRLKMAPSIIFLGRLTPKKHPIALLHAFKQVLLEVPNAILTIIGDGPLKQDVIERIEKLGVKNSVNLLGSLPRDKSFPILRNHWLYVQHSVTALNGDQEGYALSPAEAAAHELPVVSTIHNGIPEHVLDGVTGYVVPEFNYEMMAQKIVHLLKDPDQAMRFGKAGRENIKQINSCSQRTLLIKDLLIKTIKPN